jgi:DNA-binding NtrC family response regulator
MRALVIEDDPITRMIVVQLLHELEVKNVTEVESYQDAHSLIYGPVFFSLIVSDIRLGNSSALDLLIAAKDEGMLVGASIAIMTTFPQRDYVMDALNLGVSNLIIKPFDLDFAKNQLSEFLFKTKGNLFFDQSNLVGVQNADDLPAIAQIENSINDLLVEDCNFSDLVALESLFASAGLNFLYHSILKLKLYRKRISFNNAIFNKAIKDLRKHFFSSILKC